MTSTILVDQYGQSTLDEVSRSFRCISWEHSRIHEGKAFHSCRLWGNAATIANGGNADVLIQCKTGSHLVFDIAAGGNFEVYFNKSPIFTDPGTSMGIFNKNEYSENGSSNLISYTPTISGTGTQMFAKLLPGGTKTAGSGGEDGSFSREVVLKAGRDYLIRATNISGGAQPISITLEWYEI